MRPVRVHPQATSEVKKSFDWYWDQSESTATDFDRQLRDTYAYIRRNPQAGSPYLRNTRRVLLHPYPFSVIYRERPHDIQIIAVAHAKRRPGYWAKRLK